MLSGLISFIFGSQQERFFRAVESGNLEAAKAFVGQINVNAKDKVGRTALFKAAEKGHASIVKWLLTLGADANINEVSKLYNSYYASMCFVFICHFCKQLLCSFLAVLSSSTTNPYH